MVFGVNLGLVGSTGQGNEKHAEGTFERMSSRLQERLFQGPRSKQIPITGELQIVQKWHLDLNGETK